MSFNDSKVKNIPKRFVLSSSRRNSISPNISLTSNNGSKTVVVKNVTTQQIKLKYRLPETKYFSMAYPETISLVPGMQKALQASLTRTPF